MTGRPKKPTGIPELKGIRSALVPGWPNVRADEHGLLWRWDGAEWAPIGRAPGKQVTLRDAAGVPHVLRKARLICSAWHGERPAGWAVGFFDGQNTNLSPFNLQWRRTKPGYPRRLHPVDQDTIRRRATRGEKLTALAREFKVSVATVLNICRGYVKRGPSCAARRWLTADERREIFRLSESGLKQTAIAKRFNRCVKRVQEIICEERERAGTKPTRKRRNGRRLTLDGRTQTVGEWAAESGINLKTIRSRLRRNWNLNDVLTKPAAQGKPS